MKRILTLLFLGYFLSTLIASSVSAESEPPQKGASAQAYEHASEHSIFNRVGDWFATIGKSKSERQDIRQERKAKRALLQAEKELKQKRAAISQKKKKEKNEPECAHK